MHASPGWTVLPEYAGGKMAEHTHVHYRDLDLKIHEDAYGDCWVEAIGAPGSRSEPVPLVIDDPRIDGWVEQFKKREASVETCEALGRALFAALFSGEIGTIWERMRLTLGPRTALRVRLDIRHTRLKTMPWELMTPTLGEDFALVLSPNRPITRCIYDLTPITDMEPPQPLRMLVVVSQPENVPLFDAAKILRTLRETLATHQRARRIEVKTEKHVTPAGLGELLTSDYDIVHYVGHGMFDDGKGSLLLEDEAGQAQPMDGRTFGNLLVGANTRLLVIEACRLAEPSPLDPHLGVADAALHAGVPAVVAMQGPITDDEAALFSRAFYSKLIDGEPLESCVAHGRRHILTVMRDRPSWAAPVLYSNLPDGLLYDTMPRTGRRPGPEGLSAVVRDRVSHRPVESLPFPWYDEFRYRGAELTRVMHALAVREPERLVVIEGPAGSGTSTLALEAARRCLDRSREKPDAPGAFAGVVWVSGRRPHLSGPLPIQQSMGWGVEDFYRRLAEALPAPGLREVQPDERWDLVRAEMRRQRYLIVVDDFDELRGMSIQKLTDRLPAPTAIVLTSHVQLSTDAFTVGVGMLTPGQAANLVRSEVKINGAVRPLAVNLEPLGAAAGNPLALRLLAGRLADGENVTATTAARTQLPTNFQDLLRLLIRESLSRCAAVEWEALQIIAVHPEPVPLADLASVLHRTELEARAMLDHLTRLGLAQLAPDGTIFLSQRIRREALREVSGEEPEALIRRTVREALAAVERDARGPESDQPRRTYAQVRNALWACCQAYDLHDWPAVLRFRNGLHELLYRQHLWNEGIELGTMAYDAADRLDDDREEAWCALYPLARHYFKQKDYGTARIWSERALDKFTRLRDVHGMAAAIRYLARVMKALGFHQEARRLYEQGLSLPRASADSPGEAGVHPDMTAHLIDGLAELDEQEGDYERARHRYHEALAIFTSIGLPSGIATTEHRLGCIALATGDRDAARQHLTRSLRLFVRHDWPDRRAAVLKSMADLEESIGRYDLGQAYLWEAAQTLQSIGAWADLAEIEVRLTTRALRSSGPRPVMTNAGGVVSFVRRSLQEVLLGSLGAADGALLPGESDGLPQVFIQLRCPVSTCSQRRRAYDDWVDYWPQCPDHHQRMVKAALNRAAG
jgi:tetratricopeptide (TPR) repeat protein